MISDKVCWAIDCAIRAHDGQWRKGGNDGPPYVVHCIEVMRRVSLRGFGEDVLCAAVLHDILEDTNTEFVTLRVMFGQDVANMVKDLTLREDEQGDWEKKLLSQCNHMQYTQYEGVRAIKIADKTANVLDLVTHPPSWPQEKKIRYVKDANKVVSSARAYTSLQVVRNMAEEYEKVASSTLHQLRLDFTQ